LHSGYTGEGIKVGVVDTGIDYTHAAFGGSTIDYQDNDPELIEAGSFPTARVVGGYDFAGDIFRTWPGVAPRAQLYGLKVFRCSGSTVLTSLALEWAADPNKDGDFSDRLDVINLSLGGTYGSNEGSFEIISNLNALGTVIVAATGNAGSSRTFFTTSAPGIYDPVISVGNSLKTSTLYRKLEVSGWDAPDMALAPAASTPHLSHFGVIKGKLARPLSRDGCTPFKNPDEIKGKIALLDRGNCKFRVKYEQAEVAGALALIVVDNSTQDLPWNMGGVDSSLFGGMIRKTDGDQLHAALDKKFEVEVKIDPRVWFEATLGPNYIYNSSSRGPRLGDLKLKPDLAAPGRSIKAASSGSGFNYTYKTGSSMSTPHVAGAAALMLEKEPELTPFQVKAGLMNTAVQVIDLDGYNFPVSLSGAGRIDILAALDNSVYMHNNNDDLISLSFGFVETKDATVIIKDFIIENQGENQQNYNLFAQLNQNKRGVSTSVYPTYVSLEPGESAPLQLTLEIEPTQFENWQIDNVTPSVVLDNMSRHFIREIDGFVVANPESSNGKVLRLPFHSIIRASSTRKIDNYQGCALSGQDKTDITVSFTENESEIPYESVTSAFVNIPGAVTEELSALGVSICVPPDGNFEKAVLFAGMATNQQWTVPAFGYFGILGLELDTDGDGELDTSVSISSETTADDGDETTNADVFSVRIYSRNTLPVLAAKAPRVNYFEVEKLNTHLHLNNVLVLPIPLSKIGITADSTRLGIQGWTISSEGYYSAGSTIYFNPWDLPFDTCSNGIDNTPFYQGKKLQITDFNGSNFTSRSPELLLLHHTNMLGARTEKLIPDNDYLQREEVFLEMVDGTQVVTAGQTIEATFLIENRGDEPRDATLILTLEGNAVFADVFAEDECFSSEDGKKISCFLAQLAPAEIALKGFSVLGVEQGGFSLEAKVYSGLGCIAPSGQVSTSRDYLVTRETESDSSSSSGCSCNAFSSEKSNTSLQIIVLFLSLSVLWFRRFKF
jgi:subtilisin family serine protease